MGEYGITLRKGNGNSSFPSDNIDPKKKLRDDYGLAIAKAIDSNGHRVWGLAYSSYSKLKEYQKWAVGDLSSDIGKQLVRLKTNNMGSSFVPYMDWDWKDYMMKRINVVLSMTERDYEPVVKAIDPLATNKRKDFEASVRVYMDHRELFDSLGLDVLPEGVTADMLPESADDIEMWMGMNFKEKSCVAMEKVIKAIKRRNNLTEIKRQARWDKISMGTEVVWSWLDGNGDVRHRRVCPSRVVTPYTDRPDYNDIEWVAYYDSWSVQDLRNHSNLDSKEIDRIIEKFGSSDSRHRYNKWDNDSADFYDRSYDRNRTDVLHVDVLCFRYRTVNEKAYEYKPLDKKKGRPSFGERDFKYYRGREDKFKEKYPDKSLTRKRYEDIMEGYWIVGSDTVFNYGRMNHQPKRDNRMNARGLGVAIYSPNKYNGQVQPIVKKAVPILKELRRLNIQIQHLFATAKVGGLAIDFSAWMKSSFTMRDKSITPMDLLDMYAQDGILIYNGDAITANSGKPFEELRNTLDLSALQALQIAKESAVQELDELIGLNRVSSAGTLGQEAGKGVSELQYQTSLNTLQYLIESDKYTIKAIFQTSAILGLQAIKYYPDKYRNGLGDGTVDFLNSSDLLKHDYMIDVEVGPTKEEWDLLYAEAKEAQAAGLLEYPDLVTLRDIKTLSEAKQYLAMKTRQRKREAAESQKQAVEMNAQAQAQSNDQAHANQMAIEEMKFSFEQQLKMLEIEKERVKGEEERKTLALKLEMESQKEVTNQVVKNSLETPQ